MHAQIEAVHIARTVRPRVSDDADDVLDAGATTNVPPTTPEWRTGINISGPVGLYPHRRRSDAAGAAGVPRIQWR
jgi:hypothetical protein